MFGKLMKYELRYLMRTFVPMWLLVLGLCVLLRVTLWNGLSVESEILPFLVGMALYMAFVAAVIVCEVVIVVRFYKGMYGDEGYLMFTLPVNNRDLIHSKGLSATIVSVVTMIVGIVGIMILLSYGEIWEGAGEVADELFSNSGITGLELFLLVFWIFVWTFVGTTNSIYGIYMAISIGQLWRKHPIIGGILAYYGMSIVLSGAMQAVMLPLTMTADAVWMDWLMNLDIEVAAIGGLVIITLISLILTVVYYMVTKLLVDKRLNIA